MKERRTIECIWLSLISDFTADFALQGALLGTWIQLKAAVTLDPSDYEYCKLKLMLSC